MAEKRILLTRWLALTFVCIALAVTVTDFVVAPVFANVAKSGVHIISSESATAVSGHARQGENVDGAHFNTGP